jgi:glycine hydroxymethyltransferase
VDEPSAAVVAYRSALDVVEDVDPVIAVAIRGELGNRRSQLKLVASENYASPATPLAMGNWLSDKYAEGTVGHRFYAGEELVAPAHRHRRTAAGVVAPRSDRGDPR